MKSIVLLFCSFCFIVFTFCSPTVSADKEIERSSPLIVSNLAVAIPPEQVSLDDVSLVNRRMFDWARTVGTHKFNPMTEEVEVIRKFQVSRGNHSD
jgi:hypothetical protein